MDSNVRCRKRNKGKICWTTFKCRWLGFVLISGLHVKKHRQQEVNSAVLFSVNVCGMLVKTITKKKTANQFETSLYKCRFKLRREKYWYSNIIILYKLLHEGKSYNENWIPAKRKLTYWHWHLCSLVEQYLQSKLSFPEFDKKN